MKFNNILVVLDPSNEKQYALARAVRLVKEQHSEKKVKITVFISIYDFSYEISALLSAEERKNMHDEVIRERKLMIQHYLEKYADPNIEFDTTVVWSSNEADAITEEVEKHQYDLVVKYNQTEENLASLLFTPMDWQLIRKCHTPIMIVRNGDWKHQRRILIAVNTQNNDPKSNAFNQELVALGNELAHSLDRGNIHLVTAYPPISINVNLALPEFNVDNYGEDNNNQYLQNMETLRQQFHIDKDHTQVLEGYPEEIIPKVAQKLQAETVVLGSIGRTGLSAALLGNTAEHIISKLNCNLLIIKPKANE